MLACLTVESVQPDFPTFTFRLTAGLRAQLEEAADQENRSVGNLTVVLVQEGLAKRGFKRPPKKPKARRQKKGG